MTIVAHLETVCFLVAQPFLPVLSPPRGLQSTRHLSRVMNRKLALHRRALSLTLLLQRHRIASQYRLSEIKLAGGAIR
jgi:hypothetical protein